MNPICETKVLDHGLLALESMWGNDYRPARIARTSFRNSDADKTDKETERLINYLQEHHHDTPFEFCGVVFYCVMPIFVARQWVRHRAACLAGDTRISFDLPTPRHPGYPKHYSLTVRQIHERWQPTNGDQGDPLFKRRRVQGMNLRSVDESNNTLCATHISNIWSNGRKPVLKVDFGSGRILRATEDHRCFTDQGWLSLRSAIERNAKFASPARSSVPEQPEPEPFSDVELSREGWEWIDGYDGKYQISTLGRVRTFANTSNKGDGRGECRIKEPSMSRYGYPVVSLSESGRSRVRFVHHLVLEAFIGPRPKGTEARHLDGVRKNARISNLTWGSAKENALDRMSGSGSQRLSVAWISPIAWTRDGDDETFDLEVTGPFHNFIAGGVAVHNSINEESLRYVDARREFYIPAADRCQLQSQSNKQGSAVECVEDPEFVRALIERSNNASFDAYDQLLATGLARELARSVLPLGTYTAWYWQANLRMALHFLSLRADQHAQYEIRVYAEAMLDQLRPIFPTIIKAWEKVA